MDGNRDAIVKTAVALLIAVTAVTPDRVDGQLTPPAPSAGSFRYSAGGSSRPGGVSSSGNPGSPSAGSQYRRSKWRPRATYYSNRGDNAYTRPGNPAAQSPDTISIPSAPQRPGIPRGRYQAQQQRAGRLPVTGFGTSSPDPLRQQARPQNPEETSQPSEQTQTPEQQAERDRKAREEQWRQLQIQEAQRQAYIQRFGDPASQRFWRDIYSYNRSTHNQNRHGFTFHGQSRAGQNMYGYSTHNQSRHGQSYSPSFHNQNRFNQGPPIYNFHNIIVPRASIWSR